MYPKNCQFFKAQLINHLFYKNSTEITLPHLPQIEYISDLLEYLLPFIWIVILIYCLYLIRGSAPQGKILPLNLPASDRDVSPP